MGRRGIYALRSWESSGYSYHALGVPRDVAEKIDAQDLFICERKDNGQIIYTPLRSDAKDFQKEDQGV